MTNPADDILKQAHQGSVAAIIQVLNTALAESGVRTRAMLAGGVLQLLCEAATPDQLHRSPLVAQVRQTLEAIAPRPIRRVNINSRIVREEQLLWLEEISRDPQGQLLWSEEITLNKPNLLQQMFKEWQTARTNPTRLSLPQRSPHQLREQRQFRRGWAIGGGSMGLLLLAGWGLSTQLGTPSAQTQPQARDTATPPSRAASPAAPNSATVSDSFADAVRIAEKASQGGLTATTSAEWLDLAARWQQASDLMARISTSDARYQTAQGRVTMYRKNRESALQRAQQQSVTQN